MSALFEPERNESSEDSEDFALSADTVAPECAKNNSNTTLTDAKRVPPIRELLQPQNYLATISVIFLNESSGVTGSGHPVVFKFVGKSWFGS